MNWTNQYGIFFASAGHASLIDYPDAKGLQNIASKMNTDGGVISAVYDPSTSFSKTLLIQTAATAVPSSPESSTLAPASRSLPVKR